MTQTKDVNKNDLEKEGEHLLMHNWSLYFHTQSQSDTYRNSYHHVNTFDSCESWARLFNNIPEAAQLLSHTNEIWFNNEKVVAYSIFKDDIKPEWEDEINSSGSEWGCRQEIKEDDANQIWTNLVAGLVSGQLNALGARVVNKNCCSRKLSKIEIWIAQEHDPAEIYGGIQEILKTLTLIDEIPNFQLLYHDNKHREAMEFSEKKKKRYKHFKHDRYNIYGSQWSEKSYE